MSWMTLWGTVDAVSCRAIAGLLGTGSSAGGRGVRRRAAEQVHHAVPALFQPVQRQVELGGAVADLVVDGVVGEGDQQLAAVLVNLVSAGGEVSGECGSRVGDPAADRAAV